jgi:hypothetical protein
MEARFLHPSRPALGPTQDAMLTTPPSSNAEVCDFMADYRVKFTFFFSSKHNTWYGFHLHTGKVGNKLTNHSPHSDYPTEGIFMVQKTAPHCVKLSYNRLFPHISQVNNSLSFSLSTHDRIICVTDNVFKCTANK